MAQSQLIVMPGKRAAFTYSRMRLQWAKESLAEFVRCGNIYFRRTPREFFVEHDPDGIYDRHKFRFTKPLPSALTKHTVHAVEDLRASLDLAVCDVARLAKISANDVYFPFSKSKIDFKSRLNSACKGFPKEIQGLLTSYEPYADGSALLYAIKELGNASKHQIIMPVVSVVGTELPHTRDPLVKHPLNVMVYSSGQNEITYAITERGLKWEYEADFSFRIRFGEVGVVKGREVAETIDAMIRVVEMIIYEVEAESRRSGILAP